MVGRNKNFLKLLLHYLHFSDRLETDNEDDEDEARNELMKQKIKFINHNLCAQFFRQRATKSRLRQQQRLQKNYGSELFN